MRQLEMMIAGTLGAGTSFFDVENPATGEIYARAPECSPAQLEEAMSVCRGCFRVVEARRQAAADGTAWLRRTPSRHP